MNCNGKYTLVLGAGRSGQGAASVLAKFKKKVVLNDAKEFPKEIAWVENLEKLGVSVIMGHQNFELLNEAERIIVSPGIPLDIPLLLEAKKRNISVIGEVEFAWELADAPILGVTGTNGKTSTTTLLGLVLKEAGYNVAVGGNIGNSLSEVACEVNSDGYIVAELSSYQLESIDKFTPHGAIVLNITPDHLSRHKTMENYQNAKENIFRNQKRTDFLVLNLDDPAVASMKDRASSNIWWFSQREKVTNGAYCCNENIYAVLNGKSEFICSTRELQVRGKHNVDNVLAVVALTTALGISKTSLANTLSSFQGVEHRLEYVSSCNGVAYYNDSKATNPDSTVKALDSFDNPIILLAGGSDKGTDLDELMKKVKEKVVYLILFGAAAERFKQCAEKSKIKYIHLVSGLEEALEVSIKIANVGDVVLLSPACASFDQYNSFEERGEHFKQLVKNL